MKIGVLEVEHVAVFDFMSCCAVENEVPDGADMGVFLGFLLCVAVSLRVVLLSMVFLLVYVLLMNKIMFICRKVNYFIVMRLILYDREKIKIIGTVYGFLFVFNSFMLNMATGAVVC